MERGLFWLPLLILFFWLAWSGKNEYQKLENYKVWAENFDKSKYDIYAVLGKKEDIITWGKPTAKGIINESYFSLGDVQQINILVKNIVTSFEDLPDEGEGSLEFLTKKKESIIVPFTQIQLVKQWYEYLIDTPYFTL